MFTIRGYWNSRNEQLSVGGVETSRTELVNLLKAWLAISLAFSIASFGQLPLIVLLALNMATVGIAFIFHELSHKLLAQHYGCFAEFRANDQMLVFAIIGAFAGFIFAAPGAVMIIGHVSKEQNGRISAAGPAANIVLALVFLSLVYYFPVTIVNSIALIGYQINVMLALFNLIPFGILDGAKILAWSKKAYVGMLAAAILVMIPLMI